MIVFGLVVHGDGIGKTLGFPTANIQSGSKVDVLDGIYAAWTTLKDKKIPSAFVVSGNGAKLEAHFLEYGGESCYGENVSVEIVKLVGQHVKIEKTEDLIKKITNDILAVKNILYGQGN